MHLLSRSMHAARQCHERVEELWISSKGATWKIRIKMMTMVTYADIFIRLFIRNSFTWQHICDCWTYWTYFPALCMPPGSARREFRSSEFRLQLSKYTKEYCLMIKHRTCIRLLTRNVFISAAYTRLLANIIQMGM